MMKLLALTLISASLLSTAFAWTIEGEVTPHKGDSNTEIVISYLLNETVKSDARVKVYLNEYDAEENGFDYTIDKVLMDYFEVNPEDISPIILRLNDTDSGFYRICLRLAYNSSYYRDCDKGNQFLLINNNEPSVIIVNSTLPAVSVESGILERVNQSEPFTSTVKITNNKDYSINVTAYSYAYNKSKCVSEGSWLANKVQAELQSMETAGFELINRINVTGVFDFKVMVRYADGEYYDVKRRIIVLKKNESRLILSPVAQLNSSVRLTVSNTGEAEGNASLIIVTSNDSARHDVIIKPRHSFEVKQELSNIDQNVYAYLFDNGFLIDAKEFSFKQYLNETRMTKTKTENIEDSSPASVESQVSDSKSMVTGAYAFKQEELGVNMETILYLIVITVSIIGFGLLIRRF